jgi:hypothetical protein
MLSEIRLRGTLNEVKGLRYLKNRDSSLRAQNDNQSKETDDALASFCTRREHAE